MGVPFQIYVKVKKIQRVVPEMCILMNAALFVGGVRFFLTSQQIFTFTQKLSYITKQNYLGSNLRVI